MAKLVAENSYKSNDGVSGCELYDSDSDGIPELYITEPLSEDTIFYGRESIFRINHYQKPQIMSLTDTSNNGSTDVFVSEVERKIYYYKTYGTFSIAYLKNIIIGMTQIWLLIYTILLHMKKMKEENLLRLVKS